MGFSEPGVLQTCRNRLLDCLRLGGLRCQERNGSLGYFFCWITASSAVPTAVDKVCVICDSDYLKALQWFTWNYHSGPSPVPGRQVPVPALAVTCAASAPRSCFPLKEGSGQDSLSEACSAAVRVMPAPRYGLIQHLLYLGYVPARVWNSLGLGLGPYQVLQAPGPYLCKMSYKSHYLWAVPTCGG